MNSSQNDITRLPRAERDLIERFTRLMEKEMLSNQTKGDFCAWAPNAYQLIAETAYHLAKLHKAMLEVERGGVDSSRALVNEFSADVANYMAKTVQIFGE